MIAAGLVSWNGHPLLSTMPVATTHGRQTVADLLLEGRAQT